MKRFVPEKKFAYKSEDAGKVYFFAIIALLALNFIFSFIAEALASNSTLDKAEAVKEIYNSPIFNSLFALCTLLVLLCVYFLHKKIENFSYSACAITKKIKWHTVLICIFVGALSLFGLQYLTGAFDDFLALIKFPLDNSSVFDLSSAGNFILAIFVLCLIPAIGEELIFRGVILHGLKSRFSVWGSIALSSAMFPLFHMSLQQVFYQFLLGMIMAWIVLKTGSLISSMIVHFTSNFLVVTMEFIRVQTGFSFNIAHTWWFYLLAVAMAGATFAVLFIIDKFYFNKINAQNRDGINYDKTLNGENALEGNTASLHSSAESANEMQKETRTSGYLYLALSIAVIMLIISTVSSYLAG